MTIRQLIPRTAAWALAGIATGLVAGAAVAFSATSGVRGTGVGLEAQPPAVTHVPPMLTVAGEAAELRYDVYCPSSSEAADDVPCDAAGTVYLRAGSSGGFRAVAMQFDATASKGAYSARVPADVAASPLGFQYYAVVRNNATGRSTTLPAAGAAGPMWSRSLGRPVTIDLGAHVFGIVRRADARVASAAWGSGPGQVGLEGGTQQEPIGASSFDVEGLGTVSLLDEVNHRLLRFGSGRGGPGAVALPLAISGREADLAIEPDGTIDVLEFPAADQPMPLLRSYDSSGQPRSSLPLAEPMASQVRVVASGSPVVLEYPSGQWMPVRQGAGTVSQATDARPGRPVPGGGELVVYRTGTELRLALVSDSTVLRSWRILSGTPLAEVQLAQPVGDKVVVVVRTYTDASDEFVVLVLDAGGLVGQFSVDSADWAETAPLSRFRLSGGALYQLGSTAEGAFVDRYDLGVT